MSNHYLMQIGVLMVILGLDGFFVFGRSFYGVVKNKSNYAGIPDFVSERDSGSRNAERAIVFLMNTVQLVGSAILIYIGLSYIYRVTELLLSTAIAFVLSMALAWILIRIFYNTEDKERLWPKLNALRGLNQVLITVGFIIYLWISTKSIQILVTQMV